MHRTRDLLVKQRTQLVNMTRGLLAEFGIDIPKGLERALLMARRIVDGEAPDIPIEAAKIVGTLSTAGARHPRSASPNRSRSARLATWQRCCPASHDDPRHRAGWSDGTCRIHRLEELTEAKIISSSARSAAGDHSASSSIVIGE